jgi:hypothetical protein
MTVPSFLRLRSPWPWLIAAVLAAAFWFLGGYPRGMAMAYLDQARGHYEVQNYGYPAPWRGDYGRLLEEKFGVKLNAVAGCVASPWLDAYVSGYNEVSRRRLNERFHHDIFAEFAQLAEARWKAAKAK